MNARSGTELTLLGTVGHKPEYALRSALVGIGSDPGNELVIDEPTVSRKHAQIARRAGIFEIRDLGSTNGTFVNNRRIEGPTRIKSGDEIRFGGVRFDVRAGTPAQPAKRRFRHAPIVVVLLVALSGVSYQFVKNWLELLDGADVITAHQTPAATPLPLNSKPRRLTKPTKSTPVSAPSVVMRVASPPITAPPLAKPSWLALMNRYRQLAHLGPVVEDSELSHADRSHAQYLVVNFPEAVRSGAGFGAEAHREDESLPGSSPEGDAAANAGDVDEWHQVPGGNLTIQPSSAELAPEWNINRWMSGAFHRAAILNPLLREVGYGMYCASDICAACLDLYRGAEMPALASLPFAKPIAFPPDGSEVPLRSFYLEWPDPRTSCPGYKYPNGLPITLELGSFVAAKLEAFSVHRTGKSETALEACGFDADSYVNPDPAQQARVKSILHGFGMVVVLPRKPFEKGATYHVTMTVNGTNYDWAFSTPKTSSTRGHKVGGVE